MLLRDVIIMLQLREVYPGFWDTEDVAKVNGFDLDYLKKLDKMMRLVGKLNNNEMPSKIDPEIREMSIKFLEEINNVDDKDEMTVSCVRVMKLMTMCGMLKKI